MSKKHRTRWSVDEVEYLKNNIGSKPIKIIAKHLGRKPTAVIVKSKRIGVENTKDEYGITAGKIASIIQVDRRIVLDWVHKYNLPHQRHITKNTRSFIFINVSDFWGWAENNTHRINFAKIPPNTLIPEPAWVEAMRKKDHHRNLKPTAPRKNWTTIELDKLITLRNKGVIFKEIAGQLGRTPSSVRAKYNEISKKKEGLTTWL